MSFFETISGAIEDEGRDFKIKIGERIIISQEVSFSISYDYLLLEGDFSFNHSEFNNVTSEEFPNLSDAHIYFKRIKELCKHTFFRLPENEVFQIIQQPNKTLRGIVERVFNKKLSAEQTPPLLEIRLYTNKNGNKAPRVFGFIGNWGIVYILCYDPFHQIYNKTGKI